MTPAAPPWVPGAHWLHVAIGTAALLAGPAALLAVKGGQAHRLVGRIFFWSIVISAGTALVLILYRAGGSFDKASVTLLNVAMTLYYAGSGYLDARGREPAGRRSAWSADTVVALALAGFTGSLLVALLVAPDRATTSYLRGWLLVALSHAGLALAVAGDDLARLVGWPPAGPPGADRLARHLGHMLAAYAIGLSAFSQQLPRFLPGKLLWLGPFLAAAGVILLLRRRLRRPRGMLS